MSRQLSHPIAVTMGDPAGVGGDVLLKAWSRRDDARLPPFFVLDDPLRLQALARRLGISAAIQTIDDPCQVFDIFHQSIPVMPVKLATAAIPGQPDVANTRPVIESIERAVAFVRNGQAAAVVTNPISKKVLHAGGFSHPGHTEFLASLAGPDVHPVMMLACSALRVVPVTIHLSLGEAVRNLTTEAIVAAGVTTAEALRRYFAKPAPRLAVAALNPHAGEGGDMGREEIEIITPAIEQLRAMGIEIFGPAPADTLFHPDARDAYDACLCMYHDQALIPLKTIDFHNGVNVTLGLPFLRTSPDHGTAFDIAGTGRANESSLVAALRLAADMASRHHG